jgi:hypothetical protein
MGPSSRGLIDWIFFSEVCGVVSSNVTHERSRMGPLDEYQEGGRLLCCVGSVSSQGNRQSKVLGSGREVYPNNECLSDQVFLVGLS